MGWLETWFDLRCPGCHSQLDAPGLCQRCRRVSPGVEPDRVWLASYANFGGVVRAFKYQNQRELAEVLATPLALGITQSGFSANGITHVPTDPRRRFWRGYDQSALLARAIAKLTTIPYQPVLRRTRLAPSQSSRPIAKRHRLPDNLFGSRFPVSGNWILVDDVFTTGATFQRAERALRQAGAARILAVFICIS